MRYINKSYDISQLSKFRTEIMGVSILWVMLYHFAIQADTVLLLPIKAICDKGFIGVDYFMLLSGMGLYFSFAKNPDLKNFYLRRVLRIFPTYIFVVFLSRYFIYDDSLTMALWKCTTLGFWTDQSYNEWYVPSIVALYSLFPLFYNIVQQRKEKFVLYIIMGGVIISLIIAIFEPTSIIDLPHFLLLYRIPIFMFGIVLGKKLICEKSKEISIAYLISPLLVCCFLFVVYKHTSNNLYTLFVASSMTCLFLLFFFLIPLMRKVTLLKNIFKFIGSISLELYLVHLVIIDVYIPVLSNDHNSAILYGILITLVISICLKIFISNLFSLSRTI